MLLNSFRLQPALGSFESANLLARRKSCEMEEDHHTVGEDYQTSEEEQHATDEDYHHATDEDEHQTTDGDEDEDEDEDDSDGDEDGDLHTMDDEYDEYGNMEISEYRGGGPRALLTSTMLEEYGNMIISEQRISGPGALLRYTLEAPGMKITEFRAKSGECAGLTSAMVKEKFSKAGTTLNYHVYSIIHPFDPVRRRAARDAAREKRKLAANIRTERAAKARGRAAERIAAAREGRIKTLDEGVN